MKEIWSWRGIEGGNKKYVERERWIQREKESDKEDGERRREDNMWEER